MIFEETISAFKCFFYSYLGYCGTAGRFIFNVFPYPLAIDVNYW